MIPPLAIRVGYLCLHTVAGWGTRGTITSLLFPGHLLGDVEVFLGHAPGNWIIFSTEEVHDEPSVPFRPTMPPTAGATR